MKITTLELFKVPPRWQFLKVSTDEGLSGWGEPVIEGRADTVATAVRELSEYLIGRDPDGIEDFWQTLYRGGFYRGGPILMSALAGIDQALWDLKGKRHNLPVYEFFGGKVRDRIDIYSWVGGDRPQDAAQAALAKKELGYRAVKMNASAEMAYVDSPRRVAEVVAMVGAVRDAVGSDFGIAVDFHGRIHRPMAKAIVRALEPFQLMFIEEPVLSEHPEAVIEIARYTTTPIALGERLFSRWDFKPYLGVIDVFQPDVSHAGGISEVRRICALAEAYDAAAALHCPLGPLTFAASLQVDATAINAFIQEQSLGIHYNVDAEMAAYLSNPEVLQYENGSVRIPDGPGLGININEAAVREAAQRGHVWRNPIWRLSDGSIAEW